MRHLRLHALSRILPLLLPACMVDMRIVEGNDDDRDLVVDIDAWCEILCERAEECSVETAESCIGKCVAAFEVFEGKSDICEEAGERARSCLEGATCAELGRDDVCLLSEESESCLDSVDPTFCRNRDTSGAGSPDCQHGFSDCSNGEEYMLECFADGDDSRCACMTNNAIRGEFTAFACPSAEDAIQICAWPVVRANDVPATPLPTSCAAGGRAGPGSAECSMRFEGCTDGHSYGVNCAVVGQAVHCECDIDGEVVNVYASTEGICSFFAVDAYDGCIATNYACGFSIEPPPPTAD